MQKFKDMLVGEKLEKNSKLCFLFTKNSTNLNLSEVKRLIEHLQNVVKDENSAS